MGVSPRRLMGWEPAEVTTYEYDVGGRLVRSVTVREPEFSLDDRVALLRNRAAALAPRGSHGHLLSEAMSPAADPSSEDATIQFVARGPRRDYAAIAEHNARKAYEREYPDADLTGLLWAVERVEL